MRPFSKTSLSALFVGLLAVACSGQAPGDPGTSQGSLAAAPAVAAQQPDAKRRAPFHHGGRPELLDSALRLGSLNADQRAQITAENDKQRAAHQPVFDASEQLRKAVLAAASAGSVDATAFQTQVDAVSKAATSASAARVDALVRLHDILTAEQRKELVSTLQARLPKAGERPGFMGAHMKGDKMHAGHACGGGGEQGLLKGLDLSDTQRQQIADQRFLDGAGDKAGFRGRFEAERAQLDALLAAFAGVHFDASSVSDGSKMASFMKQGAERRIAMLAKLLPILDAGQRAKLVTRLSDPQFMRPATQRHERGMLQRPATPAAPAQTNPID